MNEHRLSVDLPDDVAAMLDGAVADSGRSRERFVVDALRAFLTRHIVPEVEDDEDEEQDFAEAREAMDRDEYGALDDLAR